VESFSPTSRAWRRATPMVQPRGQHAATLLADGRVLVTGGCDTLDCARVLNATEVYDPATDRWSSGGNLGTARAGHGATLLASGEVLVTGGCAEARCTPTLTSAERWSPEAMRWSAVAHMSTPRHNHSATLLRDETVIVAGGCVETGTCTRTTEIFDPRTGRWSAGGPISVERGYQAQTMLDDGRLLIAGGCNSNTCLPWAETWPRATERPDAGPRDSAVDASEADGGDASADVSVPLPDVPTSVDASDAGHRQVAPRPTCGCRTAGHAGGPRGALAAMALAWLALGVRRRR